MNILLPLLVGLFAFLFSIEQIYNYDIWWHLKAGEWALENSAIPRTDSFSFSTRGAPWIHFSWLSGIILFLFHQLVGLDGLILLKASIIGLTFGMACVFLIRRGLNPYLAALVIGLAVPIARFRFLLRPQILFFPGALAFFWALTSRSITGNRRILVLVPLMALWVNLHGSAYLGLLMALFLLLEGCILWAADRTRLKSDDHAWPRESIVLVSLLCLALLATPYGFEYPQMVFSRSVLDDLIVSTYAVGEHLPLRWGDRTEFWGLSFLTAISFLFAGKKSRIFHILLFAGVGWISLSSVRYVGVTAFLYALILGVNLQVISARSFFKQIPLVPKFQFLVLLPVLVLAGVYVFRSEFAGQKVYQFGFGINQSRYPVAAVAYLREIKYSGNVFNSWEYGGYTQWQLPNVRTVIDGRCLDAQLELHASLLNMSADEFQKFLDANQVNAAILLKKDRGYVDFFNVSPQFKMQDFDDQAVLFVRNGSNADRSTTGGGSFSLIRPESYDVSYLLPLASGGRADQVERELRLAAARFPKTFSAHFQLGYFLELRQREEALEHYFNAARTNPALGFSHFNLEKQVGRFALGQQRWQSAAEILEMAEEHGTKLDAESCFLLGTAYYRLENFAAAEKAYLRALTMEPDQLMTMINLAYVYLDSERWQRAEDMFRRATELSPDNEAAFYGLALVLQESEDPGARVMWESFLRRFPDGSLALRAKEFLAK